MLPLELPGKATPPSPAPASSPAATPPPPPTHLPPPPFVPVRLAPQAPWFLSEERRRILRASALISDPDLELAGTPELSTPPRSLGLSSTSGEEVPDSVSPAPALNAPLLRSIIVAPNHQGTAGIHGAPPARDDDEGWLSPKSRRRPRRDVLSSRRDGGVARTAPRSSQQEAAALRFKRRTKGKCCRCLAPLEHHTSAACRDPIRCLTCNLSGHLERACPLRLAAKKAKPAPARPPPRRTSSSPLAEGAPSWARVAAAPLFASATLPPPPPMAHNGTGAAAAKPAEDTVSIAMTRELDQEVKFWEETAAIAWVATMGDKRKVDALAVDRAIRKEFRLSHRDISVCPHQPMQFLVKFERKAHCTEVLSRGRVRAEGVLVQIKPWRPLEHAFGAAYSFRVPAAGADTLVPPVLLPTSLPEADVLQIMPAAQPVVQLPTSATIPVADVHAFLADQAVSLRAELHAYLDGAVKPVLAESKALRDWNTRASALLSRVPEPYPPGLNHVTSTSTTSSATSASDGPPGYDASATQARADAEVEDVAGQDEINAGSEAWNEEDRTSRSPSTPCHAPVTIVATGSATCSVLAVPDTPPADTSAMVWGGELQQFISSVAAPVEPPLINTPPARKKAAFPPLNSPRRSGRLAIKKKARQQSEDPDAGQIKKKGRQPGDGTDAIQELIARVCGILAPTASFDDDSRAAYRQLFLQAPLADNVIKGLDALVKQVKKLKKNDSSKTGAAAEKNVVDA